MSKPVNKPVKAWDLAGMCCSNVRGLIRKIMFGIKSVFFDLNYYPINVSDLVSNLLIWRTRILPRLHYERDRWDCDDFSEYFASWLKLKTNTNCAGITIGTIVLDYGNARIEVGHAWNSVLLTEESNPEATPEVAFVEPQLGIVVPSNQPIVVTKEIAEPSRGVIKTKMSTRTLGISITYKPEFFIW